MKDWMGYKAKDKITGFEGVITGHAEYVTGCDQFLVQPAAKADGEHRDGRWIDEQRLDVDESSPRIELDNSKGSGSCGEAPTK